MRTKQPPRRGIPKHTAEGLAIAMQGCGVSAIFVLVFTRSTPEIFGGIAYTTAAVMIVLGVAVWREAKQRL